MLNIVLVEPEIPQNTGNIARTCACADCTLTVVDPLGFQLSERRMKRAGLDYWDKLDIIYYNSQAEFFEQNAGAEFFYFSTKAEIAHSDMQYPNGAFLVFGKETKGLPEELLRANHDRCVRLPMRGMIRSLNLSNAVAVGTYEVLRQWGYPALTSKGHLTKYHW